MPKPQETLDTEHVCSLQGQIEEAGSGGATAVLKIWTECGSPVPVEANFPMFVVFTSGTTGKPKGLVHTHALVAGLVESMRVCFNVDPATDRMLTVAGLGWITGQSYQVSAVLASRITAVLMRGSPVSPSLTRFAEVIVKHKVTILKAGSAFLREVMSHSDGMQQVKEMRTGSVLKVASFCAEPVNEAVHTFAMESVCENYINCYWATEHGAIAWGRRFRDVAQPLRPNAHTWPMGWVEADVFVYSADRSEVMDCWEARRADAGERGEVVCTSPFPSMFRYVWGNADNFGKPGWTGDREIMLERYWRKTRLPDSEELWAYVQGDFAVKHPGGSYTFHGRSDEVLNVNGILYGTEHLEGALLRDQYLNAESVVGQCLVVGYPDTVAGEVPLAFIVPAVGRSLDMGARWKLYNLVQDTVGPVQMKFVSVSELPRTFAGKLVRRVVRSMSRGEPLGDLSTIVNQACLPKLQDDFESWTRLQ